ncbi:adhesion G-protein coupled receptor F2-like isoform X2 [Narcine bancroftii]
MMFQSRIVLCCLLMIFFCQRVEVDELHISASHLPAEDYPTVEESKSQDYLKSVNQTTYKIDIEISLHENSPAVDILQKLFENVSYPIEFPIENNTINILSITPTTVCQLKSNEIQCKCTGDFTWNSTFCRRYQPCNASTAANHSCDCIRGYPIEATFCDVTPTMVTTTQSTASPKISTIAETTPTTASTKVTTRSPKKNSTRFAFRVLNLEFTDDLRNSSSDMYKKLENEFTTLLEEAFRNVQVDADITILGFSEGSVIVLYNALTDSALTKDDVTSTNQNLMKSLSDRYKVEILPSDEIPCQNEILGIKNFNENETIPCMGMNGFKLIICGKNGQYEVRDFCVLPVLTNLDELTSSSIEVEQNFSSLLQVLSTASQNENITSPGNVEAVVNILMKFSQSNAKPNETDLENFLQTVDSVISSESINTWQILAGRPNTNLSSQLLQSVEDFTSMLNLTNSTSIIRQDNLQLYAVKIDGNENISSFERTYDHFNIEEYSNLSASINISSDELKKVKSNLIVSIAYPTWIDILSSNTLFGDNFIINGLVMTITLTVKKPLNVNMIFSARNHSLDFNTATCAFWNFTASAWDHTGCTTIQKNTSITCSCTHLTSFSILMSPSNKDNNTLKYITQIGVAVSIASLLITIIIEAIVWKQVTKNKTSHTRHVAILNIAVNLLIADVWFIVASSLTTGKKACVAATFFIHFFYLALFFWMFTLGLLLVYHLVLLFHDFTKSTLMGISFGIGYVCPLLISVITIGVAYPRGSYLRENACWLRWKEEYPILAFIIPALVIIATNIIVLIIVIYKLLRPTIGDRLRSNNEDKETFKQIVRSIVVLTPILGLTWGFGIPTFQEKSPIAFHYIFTILNAFQGFFILIFGTCMDKKVREVLLKKFSLSGFSSRTRTAHSTSTGKIRTKPGFLFPAQKNYDISGRIHSGSKDKFLSYSTLN